VKSLKGKIIKNFMFQERNFLALTVGVTNKYDLYLWGSNKYGQLFLPREIPKKEEPQLLAINNIKKAYASLQSTFVMTTDGKLYAAGHNTYF
jgi:alpha-tubulin suppressor-like RCC1 family protein